MLFSILIAHYNNFEYFKECYKSILDQTYKNFEVILVDDFSSDDSLEKIKGLVGADQRFKIFTNPENKGVGFTKKRCVEKSSGEICAFLDPDDALTFNALEESIKCFTIPNIVACYSQLYMCDENLTVQKIYPYSKQILNEDQNFLNLNFEVAHFFSFRKSAYLKTSGLNEDYRVSEDQDLILKLYEVGDFHFIPQPLYFYRIHNKGLSHDMLRVKQRHNSWHLVLLNTLQRRKVSKIYGKEVAVIENLPSFILKKQNTIWAKILRKF